MQSLEKFNRILMDEKPSDFIKANEDYMFDLIPDLFICKGFNQRNPWHPYDVYEHTLRVVDGVPADYTLRVAALFHDIGKPHVQTIDKDGVGHYYNHWAASKDIFDKFCHQNRINHSEETESINRLIFYHDINIDKLSEKELSCIVNLLGYDDVIRLFKLKRADLFAQAEQYHYLLKDYDRQENMILKKISK